MRPGKDARVGPREQSETVLGEGNSDKGKKGPGRPKGAKSKDKTEFVTRMFIKSVCATKRKSKRCKRKKKEEI